MSTSPHEAFGEDSFSVYVPNVFEIFDVVEKSEGGEEQSRKIGGWCSTEDLDRQGEVVVAKGLDFSEFVKHGWFNDNHKQDTDAGLGYPTDARLEKGRWWTEGYLLKDYPPADRIWEMAKSLRKTGTRRLGFSIEGKVVERDGHNKILRAKIRDVAVTRVPVNTSCTWDLLTKSFAEPAAIEDAAEKAIQANGSRLAGSTSAILRPEDLEAQVAIERGPRSISFDDVLQMVKGRWPHLSEKVAQRAARFAYQKRSKEA